LNSTDRKECYGTSCSTIWKSVRWENNARSLRYSQRIFSILKTGVGQTKELEKIYNDLQKLTTRFVLPGNFPIDSDFKPSSRKVSSLLEAILIREPKVPFTIKYSREDLLKHYKNNLPQAIYSEAYLHQRLLEEQLKIFKLGIEEIKNPLRSEASETAPFVDMNRRLKEVKTHYIYPSLETGRKIEELIEELDKLITPRASGGIVPNRPNMRRSIGTDSVLTALTPGEFVIRTSAVKQLGLDYLNKINSGDIFNFRKSLRGFRFQEGGLVPGSSVPAIQVDTPGGGDHIESNDSYSFTLDTPGLNPRDVAYAVVNELMLMKRSKHPQLERLLGD